MMEMEVMHPSQQEDMDLIDILWKQDIDLGARREVFDHNYRQKEYELQRQQELEEEKRLHLLQEQEKALLAQLELDEETGEYIPRLSPTAPLQPATAPQEVTQNVTFMENGDAMSFDECMQLLADAFSVEEPQNTSVYMDTPALSATYSNSIMSSEQAALSPAHLSPGPLQPPQRMTPDLEQAWMELLSLPELQQCLNMQIEDTLETKPYPLPDSPEEQNPNYSFYPMTSLAEGKTNSVNGGPVEFMNTFDGSVPSMAPADDLSQMKVKTTPLNSSFSAETFSDMFYPNTVLEESNGQNSLEKNETTTLSDISNKAPFTHMDLYSLSPGDAFDRGKPNQTEQPDSDSGISSNASPNGSSPGKSVYGSESFHSSDSEMEEMDHSPGGTESDYSEMFSLNFQPDDQAAGSLIALTKQPQEQEKKPQHHRMDPAEEGGHTTTPFTKDKQKKRSDVRLSRDEQRAKSLKIPFTVDVIINLPVDDFNEIMSKHQLNEAQLALVRDIRRRGKNKVAAQNCRKRKMENIVGLENDLDLLKEEKECLLTEKSKNITSLKEMKQQLNSLYLEVFSMLRDEQGNSYSPSEYSLQQSTEGTIFLVPRVNKKTLKSNDNHASAS
ncbi:nuclear factor erythroid 2-related factor 2a [Pholidichthys leucotaenia]